MSIIMLDGNINISQLSYTHPGNSVILSHSCRNTMGICPKGGYWLRQSSKPNFKKIACHEHIYDDSTCVTIRKGKAKAIPVPGINLS